MVIEKENKRLKKRLKTAESKITQMQNTNEKHKKQMNTNLKEKVKNLESQVKLLKSDKKKLQKEIKKLKKGEK
jgi:chaperonin cofactor prefoldin